MPDRSCPGPNRKDIQMSDIFEIECPSCGEELEFWRDDKMQKCPKCGREVLNPNKAENSQ